MSNGAKCRHLSYLTIGAGWCNDDGEGLDLEATTWKDDERPYRIDVGDSLWMSEKDLKAFIAALQELIKVRQHNLQS